MTNSQFMDYRVTKTECGGYTFVACSLLDAVIEHDISSALNAHYLPRMVKCVTMDTHGIKGRTIVAALMHKSTKAVIYVTGKCASLFVLRGRIKAQLSKTKATWKLNGGGPIIKEYLDNNPDITDDLSYWKVVYLGVVVKTADKDTEVTCYVSDEPVLFPSLVHSVIMKAYPKCVRINTNTPNRGMVL